MMQTVLQWDTAIMHWINSGWSNTFFDWLMPALRNKYVWIPLYIFCLGWILFNFSRKQSLYAILFAILSVFASDTISSKLIKNTVQRPRPCQVSTLGVIQRVPCGSGFSFTSSHAANHFCIAAFAITVFGHFMKRWKNLWWLWAFMISLAQIYVGLHYPTDILGGAVLGTIVGLSMGTIGKHYMKEVRSEQVEVRN